MSVDDGSYPGFRKLKGTVDLGRGSGVFERAVRCIQDWEVHERAGLRVTPRAAVVAPGISVVLLMRHTGVYVTMACRVVSTINSEHQWGFAYGTLPLHVEQGEELFLVEQVEDDRVNFTVNALSRPGHLVTKVGAPVARLIQREATGRYLRAMVELVSEGS